MVAQSKTHLITPQEYLIRERQADTKSEYHNGVILAMAGASPEHNTIVFNIGGELRAQLRDGDCRGFASDQRVHIPECNAYYYADLIVVCGEAQFKEVAGLQSLLNPTLVIEVLSNSTERFDRGEKFDCYDTLSSLQSYVLVAQDRPKVECYTRQADSSWRYVVTRGMAAVASLPAIGSTLRLSDVYDNISFPTPLD